MRAIDAANRAAMAAYQISSQPYIIALRAWGERYSSALGSLWQSFEASGGCTDICNIDSIGFLCYHCMRDNQERIPREAADRAGPIPQPPPLPTLQTYPACSAPNCPPGKKVWTQVIWGSPGGHFTDAKGCFIVAYSQDAPTLPPKV